MDEKVCGERIGGPKTVSPGRDYHTRYYWNRVMGNMGGLDVMGLDFGFGIRGMDVLGLVLEAVCASALGIEHGFGFDGLVGFVADLCPALENSGKFSTRAVGNFGGAKTLGSLHVFSSLHRFPARRRGLVGQFLFIVGGSA